MFLSHWWIQRVRASVVDPSNGSEIVEVAKTEEIGSKVNPAVHLFNDAWLGVFDSAVVVTNDRDIS